MCAPKTNGTMEINLYQVSAIIASAYGIAKYMKLDNPYKYTVYAVPLAIFIQMIENIYPHLNETSELNSINKSLN